MKCIIELVYLKKVKNTSKKTRRCGLIFVFCDFATRIANLLLFYALKKWYNYDTIKNTIGKNRIFKNSDKIRRINLPEKKFGGLYKLNGTRLHGDEKAAESIEGAENEKKIL